jgi:hypothetical protein
VRQRSIIDHDGKKYFFEPSVTPTAKMTSPLILLSALSVTLKPPLFGGNGQTQPTFCKPKVTKSQHSSIMTTLDGKLAYGVKMEVSLSRSYMRQNRGLDEDHE